MLSYRTQTQLEYSTVTDKSATDLVASRAPVQTHSDQPARPLVDDHHGVPQENGNMETVQHHVKPSLHSETHELWYAHVLEADSCSDLICFMN